MNNVVRLDASKDDVTGTDHCPSEDESLEFFHLCRDEAKLNGKPFTQSIWLSPALAEHLLNNNPSNRPLSVPEIARMSIDIASGNWTHNGETIVVSIEGLLNDGQHRCAAVIKANRAILTEMTFGVPRVARLTVDQGRGRKSGDIVSMGDIPNGNRVAAVGKLLWQYEKNGSVSHARHMAPTRTELLAYIDGKVESILESLHAVPDRGALLFGGMSVLGFCHYLLKERGAEEATFFVRKLVNGDNLALTDLIYKCRDRLLKHSKGKNPAAKLDLQGRVEVVLRGWNAHCEASMKKSISKTGRLPRVARIRPICEE